MSSSQSNLARFAFNIYGTLNPTETNTPSPTSSTYSPRPSTLVYHCERETTALSQLNYSLSNNESGSHHVVIGGKNYLHLLCLNSNQQHIIQDLNLVDTVNPYKITPKLSSINTIKTNENTIACGLSNGNITIYKLSPSGKSTLSNKLVDHKRTINSIDFIRQDLLISGSQDGSMKLWDLRSGNKPMITVQPNNTHSDPVRACQYSSHGNHKLLSVHDSGALCKFDLRGNSNFEKKWNLHSGPALSLHIHPELEYVATGGRDQKICVFNYGETSSGNRTPEHMINTYGPIVKVRWSAYETVGKNSLFKYDLACSYLNDDSTVTIYNLNRKYIPKQIVHSYSNKPISNFLWAQNSNHSPTLWCLTKSNVFTSYDLNSDSSVTRPIEDLPKVSMVWNNNFADLAFINQLESDEESSEEEMLRYELDIDDNPSRTSLASAPIPGASSNSPLDKPPLVRSYTHNPKVSGSPIARPRLDRNLSSTTHESNMSLPLPSAPTPQRIKKPTPISSPYIIPISLSIPSNDEYVFRALTQGYIIKIPDGFTLTDVLQMNGNIAEDIGVLRYSSIWRLLAIAMEDIPKPEPEELVIDLEKYSINDDKEPEESSNNSFIPNSVTKPHWYDLDNENLHIMTNLFNSSPTSIMVPSSNNTSIGISSSPAQSIHPLPIPIQRDELFLEKKQSSTNTLKSGLTLALSKQTEEEQIPWRLNNLVRHAIEYAILQGDLIFLATIALLLYQQFPGIITREECLDWIGNYIELLYRKRMFIQAMNVLNCVPKELGILQHYSKNINVKFLCCWCNKLLGDGCQCKKSQLNCIYCHEPCNGLSVAVSLKCGHRGHFPCLKQWFVEEENIECPAPGCEYILN